MNPDKIDYLHKQLLNQLHDLQGDFDADKLEEVIEVMTELDFEHAKKHGYGLWDKELK